MRALLSLLFSLAATAAASQGLTLAEAQDIAAQRSRQVAAQAAAASAAREMAVAAGQRPDPVLRLGIANLPVEGPDRWRVKREPMTMRSIGLMQEFTRADKLAARSRRFEQEALGAEAEQELARRAVRRDAALAWVDLHFRQRAQALVQQQRAEARLQEEAALAAVRAGRGIPAEAVAARQAVAQLDDRAAEADREVQRARIALARWIGEAASRALAAAPDTMRIPPAAALDARIAAHPQLRALAQQEAVAQAEAAAADAARRPDWTVELMYAQRASAFGDMVSVTLSVPLQVDRGRRQDRELAARHAEVERRAAERDEMLRAAVSEAQMLAASLQNTHERIRRYDATLLPLAGDRVQAALAAYRGGGTLATVLEARRADLDTRMEKLELEREAARMAAQLEFFLGSL